MLLFLLLQPYFVWKYVGMFNWIVLLPLYVILLLQEKSSDNFLFVLLFGALTILASICNGQNIVGQIFNLGLAFVFLPGLDYMNDVYERFRLIFIIIISLSIISYILFMVGVPLPSYTIAPLNTLKDYYYQAYPFFVRSLRMEDYARFCGPFDEPGALGTAALIFLLIEKFNLRRWGNIIVLIAGILSLSLFFYLALAIYLVFILFSRGIVIWNKIVIIIMLGLGVFFIFENPIANELILERVQWNEETGTIVGDDRSHSDLDYYMESIKGTETYFWGLRDLTLRDSFNDSASLNNAILRYGFVVVFLYFVLFFLFAYSYLGISWSLLTFMAMLFAVLYNRPTMFEASRLFMYVMCVYKLADISDNTEKDILDEDENTSYVIE